MVCYNQFRMNYSKGLLLYKDEPVYGVFMKLIILVMPVVMLAGSIYLFSSGDRSGGLALLFEVFVISLIFWAVFPRKYQVHEDHVLIVLGGPFSVKVGFAKIKTIAVTNRQVISINFVTKLTRNYVEIAIKRGLSIAITPISNDLFVENANRALSQWIKTN